MGSFQFSWEQERNKTFCCIVDQYQPRLGDPLIVPASQSVVRGALALGEYKEKSLD